MGATRARPPSVEALEPIMQDWAMDEKERIVAKALANDQQIVVIENLTTVENGQEECFRLTDDVDGVESEAGVLPPPPRVCK